VAKKKPTLTALQVAEFMNYDIFWGHDWYFEDDGYLDLFLRTDKKGVYVLLDPARGLLLEALQQVAVIWQGEKGKDPTNGEGYALGDLITQFVRNKKTTTLVIEVPNDKVEELKIVLREEYDVKVTE